MSKYQHISSEDLTLLGLKNPTAVIDGQRNEKTSRADNSASRLSPSSVVSASEASEIGPEPKVTHNLGISSTTKPTTNLTATPQSTSKSQTFTTDATPDSDKDVYDGAKVYIEDSKPLRQDGYQCIDFPSPHILAIYFDPFLRDGINELHPWQIDTSEELGSIAPTAKAPHRTALCAANGSGKDAYVLAPFAIWFALTKIKSLTIITSSSGTQLTAQTENYIRSLAEKVNQHFGEEIFRIRQRYIKCILSGSEIRMFATDEAGKAEGYHPLEPNAEMAIIVNEGKSVSEEIHGALKRCTGFNYWLEVSTPGEPFGFFYRACTVENLGFKFRRVTAYDCPHIERIEIERDRIELGEHSALFRSMRLAMFTSLGGTVIIGAELIEKLILTPVRKKIGASWPIRVGGDTAAGGDENCIIVGRGNKLLLEEFMRETDTTITAEWFDEMFKKKLNLDKKHEYIFMDDGNVGHSITDMLIRMGWINIRRILNQSAAINKKRFGNRGAEMWSQTARILEERFYDVTQLSEKCRTQLANRYYKQQQTQGRITLESKKDAKAHGRPSPDRADAFILHLTGLTIDDFINEEKPSEQETIEASKIKLTAEQVPQWFEEHRFEEFNKTNPTKTGKPANSSLQVLMNKQRTKSPLNKYGYNN